MIVVTTEIVSGLPHRREERAGVRRSVVRSRGLGGNIMAGLRSLMGGEIHEYTALLEDTRRQAVDRMVENATAMGANAVVRMMFDSSELGTTMSEIVAYGTAVTIAPDRRRMTLRDRLITLSGGRWLVGLCEIALRHFGAWPSWPAMPQSYSCRLVSGAPALSPRADRAEGSWLFTGERFTDPASGELIEVFERPETGERDYRRADRRPRFDVITQEKAAMPVIACPKINVWISLVPS